MASRFKYLPSVGISYADQGRIFFVCRTYGDQPETVKERIDLVCLAAAGGDTAYAKALKEYMTTDRDFNSVCMEFFLSTSTLDRLRRRFYQLYMKREGGDLR
ncbi:MAG: hypothetical protein IJT62_09200 [Oscillospiraceae bacterium]|nr:hypothetical protein [Oscillospiraceae bacterium]